MFTELEVKEKALKAIQKYSETDDEDIQNLLKYIDVLSEQNAQMKNLGANKEFSVFKKYISKGKKKARVFHATQHALIRFSERLDKIIATEPEHKMLSGINSRKHIIENFEVAFKRSSKLITENSEHVKYLKKRRKKHNYATEYFCDTLFLFVVSNGIIVTVEIADDKLRHLNKSA